MPETQPTHRTEYPLYFYPRQAAPAELVRLAAGQPVRIIRREDERVEVTTGRLYAWTFADELAGIG